MIHNLVESYLCARINSVHFYMDFLFMLIFSDSFLFFMSSRSKIPNKTIIIRMLRNLTKTDCHIYQDVELILSVVVLYEVHNLVESSLCAWIHSARFYMDVLFMFIFFIGVLPLMISSSKILK